MSTASGQGPLPGQMQTTITDSLKDVLDATPADEREALHSTVNELVSVIMGEGVTIGKSVTGTINEVVALIDQKLSSQLAAVMHHPRFQQLEGSWRGLQHLVKNSETGENMKIRVLNASKKDLQNDLENATEFDQSELFKKIYSQEYDQPGGKPYAAIIGDYQFSHNNDDMSVLEKIAGVAAAGFCPFITAPSPELFGLNSFSELNKIRDVKNDFGGKQYIRWRSFRDSDDSRFVVMAMPRVLAREPYGSNTKAIEEFNYEEVPLGPRGESVAVSHDQYTWMNAAYVLGTQMTDAFARTGWCTSIRGFANGGKVEGLPVHIFKTDDGDLDQKCPTEIAITDRREKELSDSGFLPICHYKDTDYAVFFGGQTVQNPKKYQDSPEGRAATNNAKLLTGLPYIMAVSRISHYLKVGARDKIGSQMEVEDVETWLNQWVAQYVLEDPKATPEMKAKYPLAAAKIEVVPGKYPGAYECVAHLRPWLYFEELRASMRLVASVPQKG